MNQDRDRILRMIETGQVSADDAARLLDQLAAEQRIADRVRARLLRVRVTELDSGRVKVNLTIPVGLLHVGLRLGVRLGPQLTGNALQALLHTIERGATGLVLEWQDPAEDERIELFVDER